MNHFQIDHIYYGNHRIYIKGWAVPDNLGTASVRLIGANNESISAVISYDLREDVAVNLALPEGEHRFGFTLFARVDTEKDYSLVVTDDQKKVLQKVNVRKAYEKRFSKKQEKATLLFHDFALEKRGIYEKIETEDEVYNE